MKIKRHAFSSKRSKKLTRYRSKSRLANIVGAIVVMLGVSFAICWVQQNYFPDLPKYVKNKLLIPENKKLTTEKSKSIDLVSKHQETRESFSFFEQMLQNYSKKLVSNHQQNVKRCMFYELLLRDFSSKSASKQTQVPEDLAITEEKKLESDKKAVVSLQLIGVQAKTRSEVERRSKEYSNAITYKKWDEYRNLLYVSLNENVKKILFGKEFDKNFFSRSLE